jgi:hypothetical protein
LTLVMPSVILYKSPVNNFSQIVSVMSQFNGSDVYVVQRSCTTGDTVIRQMPDITQ